MITTKDTRGLPVLDTAAAGTSSAPRPRGSMPSIKSLTYARELMTVVLLAFGFLWLLPRLAKSPIKTVNAVGRKVASPR